MVVDFGKALKNKLSGDAPVFGPWVGLPNPTAIEVMARLGFDFLLLDAEHSAIDAKDLASLLPAADLHGAPVIFRVTGTSPGEMKTALDSGAAGIMVPMVESAEQARAISDACRYAPVGRRGIGPWRASGFYADFASYMREANAATTLLVQIESAQGLAHAAEIAAVEGVDALFAGPADLASSLGLTVGQMGEELLGALKRIADAARAQGKIAAVDLTSIEHLPKLRALGFSLFTCGSDLDFITQSGQRLLADLATASKS